MSVSVNGAVRNLLCVVLVEHGGSIAPAHEVEEPLALHAQLQASLHLHHLHHVVLAIAALVVGDIQLHAVGTGVIGNHLRAAGGTCADLVDQRHGLLRLSQLCVSLGAVQQHLSIAEDDAVHRAGPVAALDEVTADECGVNVLLQRHIVAVESVGAAPDAGLLHHVVTVKHVRQSGHAHSKEQSGVGVVAGLVVVLLVEAVYQWQSVSPCAVGVHQVLRGFVEIGTSVGGAGDVGRYQAVAPVQVAVSRAVVARILYGPEALHAVLILLFGAEVVVDVGFQTVVGIECGVGIFYHLLQVLLVDARHLVGVGIVLAVSLIEVDLCQECCGAGLRGASLVYLRGGQRVESLRQVVDDELPALVVGILTVRQVVILVVGHVLVHHERNVLVEALQQEVCIGSQELHLGHALLLHVVVAGVEQCDGAVHTREAVVQAYPHVVDIPVGGEHALLHFQLMEHVAVAGARTALVGVVGAHVEVPHRER